MTQSPDPNDPLALTPLFEGGAESWLPVLKPILEKRRSAETFIGPGRSPGVVPVRELTFQALKPNPPEGWKVVVFGQNPYPRVESATGIAMFDNAFQAWKEGRFGRTVSMRCIIKAASVWKYGIDRKTRVGDLRKLLAEKDVVAPPQWFQAILAQGVLLLNASLTASSDGYMDISQHTTFWKPTVKAIVEEILKAKSKQHPDQRQGVVFLWWGNHAKQLRPMVEGIHRQYHKVPVKHIEHCNPAAQGDIFCRGNHFGDVNNTLQRLGMEPVDWLPSVGWDKEARVEAEVAQRMGDFVDKTRELHQFYLERLQSVKDEGRVLPAITGLMETPLVSFDEAMGSVKGLMNIGYASSAAKNLGNRMASQRGVGKLTRHEIAALNLYTAGSVFYGTLNATLRDPDRSRLTPYFGYLRLLFSALHKLTPTHQTLWRGVRLDLSSQYPEGEVVTWWGVSSCTSRRAVAEGFMGSSGPRSLFKVSPRTAVGIRPFSSFKGEEEYVLAPGTRLRVDRIETQARGLRLIEVSEVASEGLESAVS